MAQIVDPTKPKLWHNQFIIINLISLFSFFADYIMVTTVPLLAINVGGDESSAGSFMAIISFTALLVRPFIGGFMDLKSRKIVVILATLAFTAVALFYSLAGTIPVLLALAIIHGIGISAITTAAPTVLVDVSPPSRMEEGVGMFGIAMNLTAALGPLVALSLIATYQYKMTLRTAAVIALVAVALTVMLNYEKKARRKLASARQSAAAPAANNPLANPAAPAALPRIPRLNIRTLFARSALKPALYQGLLAFGAAIIYTFIPLYGQSRGIDNIGLFFTVNAVMGLLASYFAGQLVIRFGIRKNFYPALALVLASFILLAFAKTLPLMLVGAALYGIGNGIGFAVINIIGMKLAPVHQRGAANATLYAAMDIGISSGSFILGLVAARYGFTAIFLIAAAMIVVNLLVFTILNKEQAVADTEGQASHVILMGTEEVNIVTK